MSTLWRPSEAFPTQYGQSADELAANKACRDGHRARWVVVHRLCNYSAFNGYRRTRSRYSLLRCEHCGRLWRTDAAYVSELPDARSK